MWWTFSTNSVTVILSLNQVSRNSRRSSSPRSVRYPEKERWWQRKSSVRKKNFHELFNSLFVCFPFISQSSLFLPSSLSCYRLWQLYCSSWEPLAVCECVSILVFVWSSRRRWCVCVCCIIVQQCLVSTHPHIHTHATLNSLLIRQSNYSLFCLPAAEDCGKRRQLKCFLYWRHGRGPGVLLDF